MILSGAMMLEWLGIKHEVPEMIADGRRLRESVDGVMASGKILTRELGGDATTVAAADAVTDALFAS